MRPVLLFVGCAIAVCALPGCGETRTVVETVTAPAANASNTGSGNTGGTGNTGKAGGSSGASSSSSTLSQQNAVNAAENYLQLSGFSKQGLIDQLSSSAGNGYSIHDATVAVDSLDVNWDAQAVRSAKDYLHDSPFSCQGLIQQLSSSAGSQYTAAQAQYAATKVGLCAAGDTGNTGSGNTGNTGSGNTGNTGSGNTGNTGSGNTGNTGGGTTVAAAGPAGTLQSHLEDLGSGHYAAAFGLMTSSYQAENRDWVSARTAADPQINIISVGTPQYGDGLARVHVVFYARDSNPTPGSDTKCREFQGTAELVQQDGAWRYNPSGDVLSATVEPDSNHNCPS